MTAVHEAFPRIIFGRAYFRALIGQASRLTGISAELLRANYRKRPVAWTRFAIMTIARERGYAYQRIANELGMTDHSSAIHGHRRALQLAKGDKDYRRLLRLLRKGEGDR